MKKLKLALILLLVSSSVDALAQAFNSSKFATWTSPSATVAIRQMGSSTYHTLSWTVAAGTVTACSIQIDSSIDGITWTPAGLMAAQTCTTNGSNNVTASANYIRIYLTSLTGTGGPQVNAQYYGYPSPPGGGGGGTMIYPGAGVAISTGTAWTASKANPTGAFVGTTDTQTLTNKTVNGVAPATFPFLDPTSSVQTQLNTLTTNVGNKVNTSTTVNTHPLSANVTVTQSDVGLSNVNNTSDASKPISTATATALAGKADLTSGSVAISQGGTGASTKVGAFNALQPMGAIGDLIVGGAAGVATVLNIGASGTCLVSGGSGVAPSWTTCPGGGGGGLTGSALAATQVAVADTTGSVTSYPGFTSDSAGNVTVNTITTTGSTGGNLIGINATTATPSLVSSAFNLIGPNATSMTAYGWRVPTSSPSAGVLHVGAPSAAISNLTVGQVDLVADVTGIVGVGNGGTGLATGISGGVPYFSSSSAITSSGALTSNKMVVGGGAGNPPASAATVTYNGTDTVTLGTAGSTLGKLAFANATSGTVTVNAVSGVALGSNVISLPAATGTVVLAVASGTAALGTGAIASATCATAVTVSATGVLTTDVVRASFNGDPTAVTGYTPSSSGMLTIIPYPTTNNVNFKVCNNTSASITPGAITLNWAVTR